MAGEFVAEEWPICCLGQARVTGDGLRCRAARSLEAQVLATFASGQIVDVWCRVAGWWLVQVPSTALRAAADAAVVTGWSWGEFLTMM